MIKELKIYEDFKKIIQVFQAAPFYEKLTEADMKEEYETYMSDKGGAFVYYNNLNEIQGINCYTFGAEKEHGIIFPNNDQIAYISGMATLMEARGKGISTQLFEYTMDYFKSLQAIDYVYLRTNLEGSMSSGIAKKHGFITLMKENQIYTQAVQYERINNGQIETDIRKFMAISLNEDTNCDKIKIMK